ncbi:hypothetical protein QUF74_02985 [Candidatus Halobeggiatoa sp. HSG11]|nr:hypothetical protein [Candidatus Halobeggiatoa sp. HSG11]
MNALTKIGLLYLLTIPVAIEAIEFSDYKNPDSFYDEAYIKGDFDLSSGNEAQTSFRGNASGKYETHYRTLPFVWNFDFNGKVYIKREGTEGSSTEKNHDSTINTDVNKYFTNTNFLRYGSIDLGYRKLLAKETDDPYAKMGVGVGYGRITNATPLVNVTRFISKLKELGVISKKVNDNTYLELAEIVREGGDIKRIETVLQEAEIIKTSLSAISIIKINEILAKKRITVREYGWLVKTGIGYVASNYDGSENISSLDFSFEYALPMSHKFQFNNLVKYSAIIDDNIGHQLKNELSFIYEVSHRFDWENTWNFDYFSNYTMSQSFNNSVIEYVDGEILANQLSSIFHYYLSNGTSVDFTVKLTQVKDGVDGNGNDELEKALFMGITYRLK